MVQNLQPILDAQRDGERVVPPARLPLLCCPPCGPLRRHAQPLHDDRHGRPHCPALVIPGNQYMSFHIARQVGHMGRHIWLRRTFIYNGYLWLSIQLL